MSLYDLPNSTSGLDAIVVDTVTAMPSLTPLILLFTFFVVWLGGMARQRMRTGTADAALWCVVGSLATFMIAMIMTMIEGIIRLEWLAVVIVITILSGFWLFMDRKQGEI